MYVAREWFGAAREEDVTNPFDGSVILKPARHTPLTGLWLTRKPLEAGLPENAIQCLTGFGSELEHVLCSDPRVREISFTGSTASGEMTELKTVVFHPS